MIPYMWAVNVMYQRSHTPGRPRGRAGWQSLCLPEEGLTCPGSQAAGLTYRAIAAGSHDVIPCRVSPITPQQTKLQSIWRKLLWNYVDHLTMECMNEGLYFKFKKSFTVASIVQTCCLGNKTNVINPRIF